MNLSPEYLIFFTTKKKFIIMRFLQNILKKMVFEIFLTFYFFNLFYTILNYLKIETNSKFKEKQTF
jgi:hypothetical protein